jgi:hypothetical protein
MKKPDRPLIARTEEGERMETVLRMCADDCMHSKQCDADYEERVAEALIRDYEERESAATEPE